MAEACNPSSFFPSSRNGERYSAERNTLDEYARRFHAGSWRVSKSYCRLIANASIINSPNYRRGHSSRKYGASIFKCTFYDPGSADPSDLSPGGRLPTLNNVSMPFYREALEFTSPRKPRRKMDSFAAPSANNDRPERKCALY
jgi:hypothetical protein